MPAFLIGRGRTSVSLGSSNELARAGEGVIYSVPGRADIVAKVWHPVNQTLERGQKLMAMLSDSPDDPTLVSGHRSICWPTDVLFENGKTVGFIMPRLDKGMVELTEIYHPGARKKAFPFMTYQHLVVVARNIASVFEALHLKGYVIGDINFKNWMVVAKDCQVSVIDTDSFQVREPSGVVHYCTVGTPGYIAPEMRGKDFSKGVARTASQDTFGLGVLLFQLLMNGNHPTRGYLPKSYGSEEQQRIDAGAFPWGKNRPTDQKPLQLLAPLYEALTPELQQLFHACFCDGYRNPMARPSAEQWRRALDLTYKGLVTCSANKQHCYSSHRGSCVWCELERNIRIPPPAAQQNVGGQLRIGGASPIPVVAPVLKQTQNVSSTTWKKGGLSKFIGLALIGIPIFLYLIGFIIPKTGGEIAKDNPNPKAKAIPQHKVNPHLPTMKTSALVLGMGESQIGFERDGSMGYVYWHGRLLDDSCLSENRYVLLSSPSNRYVAGFCSRTGEPNISPSRLLDIQNQQIVYSGFGCMFGNGAPQYSWINEDTLGSATCHINVADLMKAKAKPVQQVYTDTRFPDEPNRPGVVGMPVQEPHPTSPRQPQPPSPNEINSPF